MVDSLVIEKENIKPSFSLENLKLIDDNSDVCVLLLKQNAEISNLDILGKSCVEWVKNSIRDFSVLELEYNGEDIVKFVKEKLHLINKKYVLTVFSNMPLIQTSTILSGLEYFKIKSLSVLKMTNSYIFDVDYIKNVDKIYNPQTLNINEEDFIVLNTLTKLPLVFNILKKRVMNFHLNAGVVIYDENTTIIEAEANIGKGVKIYPFNTIKGECYIESGVVLKTNNLIENSIIRENCEIENSIIKNCVISENCKVLDFSCVENNIVVAKDCTLKNKQVSGDK